MSLHFYLNKLAFIAPVVVLLAAPAAAQPTISTVTPTANGNSAPRSTPVTVSFSQPLNAGSAAALRVLSNQRGGLRSGNSGAVTLNNDLLTFTPTHSFRAGETVKVTVTTAAQSSSGALATPRGFQFTTAASGGNGVFTNGSNVGTGSNPYNVTLADIDNDGDLDILAPDFGGAAVSIQFNRGNGLYSGSASASVGSQPRSVTAADIDGDGDLDLLTANYNANTASVRFNNGSGVFSGGADLTVGSQPQSITTADVDGDGDLDFLVANGAGGSVSVRLNDGTGTFGGGTTVAVGSFPFNVTTGDVDGDGDFDLLTANMGTGSNTVSVRLNNGSGLFSAGTDAVMGSRPRWIALGDLNNDGKLDLISANFGSNDASVRFNNGSGVFSGGTELAAGSGPSSVAAADIDGDGDLDMLVSNFFSNSVTIRLNNGSGVFGTSTTFATNVNPNGIATGDVDNDGDLDLLSANFGSNTLNVGFNNVITITDLVVSTPENVSGTYRNVTITGPATGGAGTATLTDTLKVLGTLTIQDGGSLITACKPLIGPGNFVLEAGGTLGICDPLGIELTGNTGSVRLSGSRSFSNDASYIYNGTLAQVTGGALPTQVRNLTTTNANNVTLNAAATVMQALTVGSSGNLVLNGRALTLPSGATGTALVVNTGTGIVQGNTALMQRYIDPSVNAGLGYRHYSTPVAATTVADLTTSGFAPVLNSAYNSSASPGQVTPFPTVFGYDQSRLATVSSNYTAFDKGWFSPLSSSDALTVGRGYTVNITASEKIDFSGTLNNGDQAVALARNTGATAADAGWALVGNPYPAPLDWSLVNAGDRPSLDAAMYVFESSNQYSGNYRTYANGVGSTPLIGSSQGFFVRVSTGQTTGNLIFRNAQRVTSYATQVPMRRGTADIRPLVQLDLQGTNGPVDALFVYAEAGATSSFDSQYDAVKLPNPSGLNLAVVVANMPAQAIAGLAKFTTATVLPLSIGVPASGGYTLRAAQLLNLPSGLDAYLFDTQTNQQINLRQQASYSFSVSPQQAAQAITNRFELRFGPTAGPLATTGNHAAPELLVFPNPAHTQFTVALPTIAGTAPVKAAIYNSLGQQVRADILLSAIETMVDVAGLAKGIYTIRVQTGTTPIVKRVVIE